jgi:hypothetical protein
MNLDNNVIGCYLAVTRHHDKEQPFTTREDDFMVKGAEPTEIVTGDSSKPKKK